MKDHIVIIGTVKLKEILRILMTIIEIRGIDNIPMILIIGDKKLSDIDLEKLFRNALSAEKIRYLSVIDGIDLSTYKKAAIE